MRRIIAIALLSVIATEAAAQTTTSGSAACATLTQAAANGAAARVAADNQTIQPPSSVTTLTCLNNFFSGAGLNIIANLLDPQNLLQAVEGQLCAVVNQTWNQVLGGTGQCGITLTGFNLGFGAAGALGGGAFCPKLTFGGGGPPIGTIGIGASNGTAIPVQGSAVVPTGYTAPPTQGLW
jgi:hypothetical protein